MAKNILKSICKVVYYAGRGTAEMFGMFFFFICIAGRTSNGEWALGSMINGSITKNGVFYTVLLLLMLFALGGIYKYEIDKEENHSKKDLL